MTGHKQAVHTTDGNRPSSIHSKVQSHTVYPPSKDFSTSHTYTRASTLHLLLNKIKVPREHDSTNPQWHHRHTYKNTSKTVTAELGFSFKKTEGCSAFLQATRRQGFWL